ncbi:MAG: 30S ribosomal protein S12 methylthiotransferase RimO [Clostridia bacterium]|nr:30S ribosomal protein S12 methylthiotransferase RimO [Clostridia bacterium]
MLNKNVALVTLGCSKNEVDSEMVLGYLRAKGFNITNNLSEANIIIVNTCGFIESAKEEAIRVILELADYKEIGTCTDLVVIGCMAKRYKKEILANFEEVDLVIGVDEYNNIDEIFSNHFKLNKNNLCLKFTDRIISTKFPTAYIRISDGCNNNCNYCAIPLIRGKLKSRTIEDIYEEAEGLVKQGIKELVIIAQDTTSYGVDIYKKPMLNKLLKELSKLDVEWIRVLYMYPGKVNDELLDEIANNNKICKYFDLPIQHISNNMLKKMNRHTNKEETYALLNKIRERIPDAIIRTTVLVGYPGETEEDFEELLECVKEFKFDRLGAFTYSREEDTVGYNESNQIDESVKKNRLDKIMYVQQKILEKEMKKNIGKELKVLVTDVTDDEMYFECRSHMDAPDVDPKIYLPIKTPNIIIGEFYIVKITNVHGYDYLCEYVEQREEINV